MRSIKDIDSQAKRLHKIIRDHYVYFSNQAEMILDRFSYTLLAQNIDDIYLCDFKSCVNKLNKEIKHFLISSINKCHLRYMHVFKEIFKINKKINKDYCWEQICENINNFVDKFTSDIYSYLNSLTKINTQEEISLAFPIESGKGKFHGRIKTMLYMMLSYSMFVFSSSLLDSYCCYDYSDSEIISCIDGCFYSDKEKHILWDVDNGIRKGNSIPSYFGSKEIAIPTTS